MADVLVSIDKTIDINGSAAETTIYGIAMLEVYMKLSL